LEGPRFRLPQQPLHLGEGLPTFIDVSQAHILDDAQGDRGWLENASPSAMAVEELPLGP
jgi:hypothetical protein